MRPADGERRREKEEARKEKEYKNKKERRRAARKEGGSANQFEKSRNKARRTERNAKHRSGGAIASIFSGE